MASPGVFTNVTVMGRPEDGPLPDKESQFDRSLMTNMVRPATRSLILVFLALLFYVFRIDILYIWFGSPTSFIHSDFVMYMNTTGPPDLHFWPPGRDSG
jgi:hypothetical protein